MKYSVDIARDIDSLAICIKRVNNGINNIYDWRVSINAGGIDYGIYFNFDIDRKELEISNQPNGIAIDSLCLDEIIEIINDEDEEDYE
jgi:hypothetical protein